MLAPNENPDQPSVVWTIAGSDCGGGAGIQADLLTFNDFGVHGCTVIAALTAQNSQQVTQTQSVSRDMLQAQIEALDSDLPAAAIKLGMLGSAEVVETLAAYLQNYDGLVVCDPVMSASRGGDLLTNDAAELLKRQLLPRIDLLTPNVPEAEALSGMAIDSPEQLVAAAAQLISMGARAVLLTGGHFPARHGQRLDYFTDGQRSFWLAGEDIHSPHNHGSGCTLSSAIAAAVGRGFELDDALVLAKAYVTQGIRHARAIGAGPGPVAHCGWPADIADLPMLWPQLPDSAPGAFIDCGSEPLGLYPVVDSADWVARLAPLGIRTLQLRIKDGEREDLSEQIARAIAIGKQHNCRLFINDHWQLAIEQGAYGIHLGQEDLDIADLGAIKSAGIRLGVSTHSYAEIARAHGLQPSYIAIGPIYPTTTKVMRWVEQGLERLQGWVELLSPRYPLTAIGGIDIERTPRVLATGIGSCAMVRAITEAGDYREAVRQLQQLHDSC